MKKSALLAATLLLGFLLSGCANTQKAPERLKESIQDVVQHPHSQKVAFNKSKRWAAQNFNSANSVIQEEDEESGTLVMKGVESVKNVSGGGMTPYYDVSYTLTLDIRDEKMRLTFTPRTTEENILRTGMAKNIREFYKNDLKPNLLKEVRQSDSF